MLRAIRLPRNDERLTHYYRKVGTRKAQAISKVCFAAVAGVKDGNIEHVRIALGSVAPIPIRCFKTENAVNGQALNDQTIAAATSHWRTKSLLSMTFALPKITVCRFH